MQDVNPGGCLASVPMKQKGLKRSEHRAESIFIQVQCGFDWHTESYGVTMVLRRSWLYQDDHKVCQAMKFIVHCMGAKLEGM